MNGNGGLITPASLAAERRSQPQQIADLRAQVLELQGRHSALVQQAADDSRKLHALTNDHEAALLHFRNELDDVIARQRRQTVTAELTVEALEKIKPHIQAAQAFRSRSFMARIRWIFRGR